MFDQPLPHPPLPRLGDLGPDPEPIGTERFERLMRRAFATPGPAPATLEERRSTQATCRPPSQRRRAA